MDDRRKAFFLVLGVLLMFNVARVLNIIYKPSTTNNTVVANSTGSQVTASLHDAGYENAWIQFVESGLVQVQGVDSRMVIVFRPNPSDLERFSAGSIAPITFECPNGYNEKCNLQEPYKLYVSNLVVEPVKVVVKNGLSKTPNFP